MHSQSLRVLADEHRSKVFLETLDGPSRKPNARR